LAIFVSAFLLFQIQPMISKYILPWFGGGTSVWTTAQVFFQMALLGGYGYAHGLSRLRTSRQGRLHLGLAVVVAAWLIVMGLRWGTPVTPDASWKPVVGADPGWQVLGVLLVSVGLPYFLLSTSSSLLQSWYSRLHREESPYWFYVLSNTASLLALLSYPVIVEPNLTLHEQAVGWTAGFGFYLVVLGMCAWQVLRRTPDAVPASAAVDPNPNQAILQATNEVELEAALRGLEPGPEMRDSPPRWGKYLFWIGLAACASTMYLAVTNQITQDIASVPFLWVLPLSLYLLTFIVGFNDWIARQSELLVVLMLVALGVGLYTLTKPSQLPLWALILSNCFVLFVVCLFCHSQLYRDRPHPRYLTSFYLMLSIGGALGGVLVSLVAPWLFRGFWEFPLALVFCALVIISMTYRQRGSLLYRVRIPVVVLTLSLVIYIVAMPVMTFSTALIVKRNFYGLMRIRESGYAVGEETIKVHTMVNGSIIHGLQAIDEPWRSRPTTYYTENSGAALAIRNSSVRLSGRPLRAGLIGLGIGTLAYYGQQGDTFRFYEIDPQVIEAAQDERFFTYMRDSVAQIEIVEGDARLSMERELQQGGSQRYDVLVIDAFSGDSIPVHLLSKEAVDLYLEHLAPDGVLAFHISNRYIELEPVLWRMQEEYGFEGAYVQGGGPLGFENTSWWVLLTYDTEFMEELAKNAQMRVLNSSPEMRLWTDDYSNLFQVLK
jgi:hypothetical protein